MYKIDEIENAKFLKKLSNEELKKLSKDMRDFILENVSQTGGHLSSNLGIVDLTIAMLKVFDLEKDIIIFDVGHQSYPYKILTGRANKFKTLRKLNGLSGFQSIIESKYDYYEGGHSSTSISAGVGFSIARDLDKKKHSIISVIGDGSIGNGLAYEALNHIGDLKTKQIIILNDNQMSISKNVGALHNFLDEVRAAKGYNKAKDNTKSILNRTRVGRGLFKIINFIKESFKKMYLSKASLFDDFGIEYYGPINGHDYEELIKYLKIAKKETKPVILHVITQKGKGYALAEDDKIGKFHGLSSFDLETGLSKSNTLPSYSEIISSNIYELAKKDKDIICITPGMCYGSKLETIKEKLPKQYIDVGIAEEHALVLANSLALSGKKPIVFIYSTFLQRGYDMLVHDIARMDTGVILCIDRAGLVPGDGVSHQGVFDIPFMMSIPNMIITTPKDAKEAKDLIATAVGTKHPFAIRYPRLNADNTIDEGHKIKVGSWEILKDGKDGTIISYGDFVNRALEIANKLSLDNINLKVVNARFIKPFDKEMFENVVKENKPIFVYEESQKIGSLGNILSMEIQKYNTNSKLEVFAIEDKFLTHASREELIKLCELDNETIVNKIKNVLKTNKTKK